MSDIRCAFAAPDRSMVLRSNNIYSPTLIPICLTSSFPSADFRSRRDLLVFSFFNFRGERERNTMPIIGSSTSRQSGTHSSHPQSFPQQPFSYSKNSHTGLDIPPYDSTSDNTRTKLTTWLLPHRNKRCVATTFLIFRTSYTKLNDFGSTRRDWQKR